tara:strand:- start:165 stop:389 length:225 start_codon:yes stop_codon:yes gene_type:complete
MKEMTKLIEKNDPRYFSQTSNKPYDRHYYRIVCQDKSFVVQSWQEVVECWWNKRQFVSPVIEVIDKPKLKKGFK